MNQRLLSCGIFIDLKKPSAPSITTFYLISSITMAFVEYLMIGSPHISNTARKQRKYTIIFQIKTSLGVVFPKDQFLDHCFSCYMSMISTDAQINLGFTFLQMKLTFSMWTKISKILRQ